MQCQQLLMIFVLNQRLCKHGAHLALRLQSMLTTDENIADTSRMTYCTYFAGSMPLAWQCVPGNHFSNSCWGGAGKWKKAGLVCCKVACALELLSSALSCLSTQPHALAKYWRIWSSDLQIVSQLSAYGLP